MNLFSNNVLKLAKAFSVVLNDWVPEKIYEINLRNKEESYVTNGFCATHDFCDPNQAMIDAFKTCFGGEPSVQNKRHINLMDKAWIMAKTAEFKVDSPLYNKIK